MGQDISDQTIFSVNGTNYSTDQAILAELRLISFLLAPIGGIAQDPTILDDLRSEFLGAL